MQINVISGQIVDTAFLIHRELGPGLLESAYQTVLAHELRSRNLEVECNRLVPIRFRGVVVAQGFRADMVVQDQVIVELKSVEKLAPVHAKQVLTYLRLMDRRLGLLINFGESLLKDGIHRIVNGLRE